MPFYRLLKCFTFKYKPIGLYQTSLHIVTPKFVAELLTFLLCVREIPGSNIDQETGYPDWLFHDFSQSLLVNAWIYLKIRPRPFPSTSFLIHRLIHLITVRRYIVWVTEKEWLNKQVVALLYPVKKTDMRNALCQYYTRQNFVTGLLTSLSWTNCVTNQSMARMSGA
jgi:hypothetical protein